MASSTCELIHIFTEIYHRDWQTGPITRRWMGTMLVFCLLNVLVDVGYLCSATAVYLVLLEMESRLASTFLVIWCITLANWVIEVFASVGMAVGRRGKVTPRVMLIVTNYFFTAVQYGPLPLVTYMSLAAITDINYTVVMQEHPGLRCFLYLSIIQGTSFGLATFLMAAWAKEDRIRGGNLFLSILGIAFSCSIKAYHEKSQIKTNWPIILARSIIYSFLMTVLYINGIILFNYYWPHAEVLEMATGYTLFTFLIIAVLPFLIASTLLFYFCCCLYCCCVCS